MVAAARAFGDIAGDEHCSISPKGHAYISTNPTPSSTRGAFLSIDHQRGRRGRRCFFLRSKAGTYLGIMSSARSIPRIMTQISDGSETTCVRVEMCTPPTSTR